MIGVSASPQVTEARRNAEPNAARMCLMALRSAALVQVDCRDDALDRLCLALDGVERSAVRHLQKALDAKHGRCRLGHGLETLGADETHGRSDVQLVARHGALRCTSAARG